MKRLTVLLIIAVLFAGNIFAQGIVDEPQGNDGRSEPRLRPQQRSDQRQRPAPQQRNEPRQRDATPQRNAPQRPMPLPETVKTVTITGTLQLQKGFIVLVSGENTYHVPMITRLTGFIDGLKEGKEISVEGLENKNFIHLVKLTVDGKSYDFPAYARGQGNFGPDRGQPGFDRFEKGRDNNRGRDWQGPGRNAPNRNKGHHHDRGSCC
jgi:hypothetical protein